MQESINNQSMLKVGTILHGTYRIDSYLSSGGFGNTYVATNIEFEERVAIKEFFMKGVTQRDDNQTTVSVSNSENTNSFQEQKEKFKKEARRIRQLKNEHIVKVHDMFDENGTAYYVMDYVDGENLSERLKRTGRPMTESEVSLILPQILNALKAVHNEGFCHLDIKPSNIMLDKGGKIKIIDFGASKQLGANGTLTTNAPTAFAQTPGYAPREQMEQNLDKIGPWTDIYALGATLYNLLTNKRPPMPTDIDDDMSDDKHLALPFPDSISDLRFLVLQMMKTNRLQRPQNIDAIDIETKQEQSPTSGSRYSQNSNWVESPWSTVEDGEETVIENSHHTDKEEKPQTDERPKVTPQPESSIFDESQYGHDSDDNSTNIWKVLGIIAVIVLIVYILIPKGNVVPVQESNGQDTELLEPKKVDRMSYQTAIGSCQYSGPVDNNNVPHGIGEAFFNDGRYYKGNFAHGTLTGKDAYFKYSNGDTFEGEFRDNAFYFGKYTIAEDKSYFVGYYKKGQPNGGTWYNRNGKVIQ